MVALCSFPGGAPYARSMSSDVTHRVATPRSYLMCPPAYFDVSYAINPWMHPGVTVDAGLARGSGPRCGPRTSRSATGSR